MVSRVRKCSLSIKSCRRIFFRFFVLVSLSIIMKFACLLKLCFFLENACIANMVENKDGDFFHHFSSYLVLYWKWSLPFIHIVVYITCIPSSIWHVALQQLTSWQILFVFWVYWLLKVNVVMTWLWHRVQLFSKHGEHFSGFKVLLFIIPAMLFSILLLPMSSLKFLLCLKTLTGLFWKIFFKDLLTDSMFHLFQ